MLDRLGQADRVTGLGAAAALVSTFLPWYRFHDAHDEIAANGFGAGFLGDVVFVAAAATILLLLVRAGVIHMPGLSVEPRLLMGIAVAALGATVLQLLIGIDGSGAFHSATIGIVVALFASAAMVVGARMQQNELPGRHAVGRR